MCDCLNVSLILPEWISKLVFMTIDILRPILAVLSAINPSLVVFCLYYEDPIDRNNHMVNLGAMTSRLKQQVINNPILFLGKKR